MRSHDFVINYGPKKGKFEKCRLDRENRIQISGRELRCILNWSGFSDLRILNVERGRGGGAWGFWLLARFIDKKIANHESRKSKCHFSFSFTIINMWTAVFFFILFFHKEKLAKEWSGNEKKDWNGSPLLGLFKSTYVWHQRLPVFPRNIFNDVQQLCIHCVYIHQYQIFPLL